VNFTNIRKTHIGSFQNKHIVMLRHLIALSFLLTLKLAAADKPPNILFFFVDDWGRYAGIYSNPKLPSPNDVIKTPNIDRIGREGVVFDNAFVPVSSCGPCRASLATGRYFWNCGSGAFLNGKASNWSAHKDPLTTMTKFPDLLRANGYLASKSGKTIAFAESKTTQTEPLAPKVKYQRYGLYVSTAKTEEDRQQRIRETLDHPRFDMRRVVKSAQAAAQPFFFIYGTINVHRPWKADSGQKLWGIDPDSLKGRIPKFLPDVADVRRDFADYLGEVQAADAMLGVMLAELEAAGELDNTVVILSGDNGVPGIPRGKTNCYDLSASAPMLVRWPKGIPAGRRVDDFVSVMDIGPTLLELAGVQVPAEMDGRSFLPQLANKASGWIDPQRDSVVIGRELHFHSARDGNLPYPMRAIRSKDHLYIRNFKPDRWPGGAPYNLDDSTAAADYERIEDGPYRDLDAGLTKSWLLENRSDPAVHAAIELTLGKRPDEELYAIQTDPHSLHNLADDPASRAVKADLSKKLSTIQQKTNDPRLIDAFDKPPYVSPRKPARTPKS
jgi:N-sulfoglucosamine sulfohydrolase